MQLKPVLWYSTQVHDVLVSQKWKYLGAYTPSTSIKKDYFVNMMQGRYREGTLILLPPPPPD